MSNQASEDEELRDKLLNIFDPYTIGDWTDNSVWRISNADTFIATMQEVEQLIRTEKLKLLAEVRERSQEVYTPVFRVDAVLISEINKLEAEL